MAYVFHVFGVVLLLGAGAVFAIYPPIDQPLSPIWVAAIVANGLILLAIGGVLSRLDSISKSAKELKNLAKEALDK